MTTIQGVRFDVARRPDPAWVRPVIGVDGPVHGADHLYDHHATGEPINLLAIPETVPFPGTIVTTLLDTDSIASAAVVLLRAAGESRAMEAAWPTLFEASHHCDHLVPSGMYPRQEQAGLGLHCWLRERGFAAREVLPDTDRRPAIFRNLSLALFDAAVSGEIPASRLWFRRLARMEKVARNSVVEKRGGVAVLRPASYLDPVVVYRALEADVVLLETPLPNGRTKYTVGVSPTAAVRYDLRPVLHRLGLLEPGWGGRANVCGSPIPDGSALSRDQVLATIVLEYPMLAS